MSFLGLRLVALLRHPLASAFLGLLLMASGVGEVLEPFMDGIEGNEKKFGPHHGVTLLGLYTLLHSLGALMAGLKDMEEGVQAMRRPDGE